MVGVWMTPCKNGQCEISVRRDGINKIVIATQTPLSDAQAEELFWCIGAMQRSGKTLKELLKEQEAKWIHREDMDFIDKYNCTHFHGMCTNCGLVHDFIDGHTGQYLYCPQCGRSVKWDGR